MVDCYILIRESTGHSCLKAKEVAMPVRGEEVLPLKKPGYLHVHSFPSGLEDKLAEDRGFLSLSRRPAQMLLKRNQANPSAMLFSSSVTVNCRQRDHGRLVKNVFKLAHRQEYRSMKMLK